MGNWSNVQLSFDKGADIKFCDNKKQTPLHIAGNWGHGSTMQILISKGVDVNLHDNDEGTPLLRSWTKRKHRLSNYWY